VIPASTYRLQLHAGFDLDAARALVPYLHDLGVDWVYLSPVFAARRGSEHGYDVVAPDVVNPELGGRAAFDRLVAAARDAGLGVLLDIVPNHQAASTQNPRWVAMLRDGPGSEAAAWFDVDWDAGTPPGTLVWPLLERELDDEIARREVVLDAGPDGVPVVRAHGEVLPVAGAGDDLRSVLDAQCYRLVPWRTGGRLRNYRRFFDVSELAGVRVEDPAVRWASHVLVCDLVESRAVQGLRVDHVDGLADPTGYLEWLAAATGVPVFVEKILAADEDLPAGWPVTGTTGYEMGAALTAVLVEPDGRARLEDALLREHDGVRFATVQRRAKREVLFGLFDAEWRSVCRALERAAAEAGTEAAPGALADALAAVTIALSVYRTYRTDGPALPGDRARIDDAVRAAEPGVDPGALAAVRELLVGETGGGAGAALVTRWQQLTGAVTAKGHEDTACYRYPALLAQAEVGGDPGDDATGALALLHRRAARHRGLVATTTHDTKRGEDVRARLAVLSELPGEFERGLARWRRRVGAGRGVTPVEQRFVAQTLLGAWPLDDDLDRFATRVEAYLTKALREAKQASSWTSPDPDHEAAVVALASRSVARGGRLLREAFGRLVDDVALHGACNGLAQLTWKLGMPGVVDVYRGAELWDLSLVDPDNRRPVDFSARAGILAAGGADLAGWRSGAVKLHMTARGLAARRARRALFTEGEYRPLEAQGPRAACVVAFARRGEGWAVAVAPRHSTRVARGAFPLGAVWEGTRVVLPTSAPTAWVDAFTDRSVVARDGALDTTSVFADLPGALLVEA
jgi:malto-oligosyltrehalose synthase